MERTDIKLITDDMENKELNLVELLKGHEGRILYSPLCGTTELYDIVENDDFPIKTEEYNFKKDGRFLDNYLGKCMLFPSEKIYIQYPIDPHTAWAKWAEENKKVTYGDVCRTLFEHGAWQPADYENKFTFTKDANETYMLNGTSEKQLKKLRAINKLMNTQKVIEKGWQPYWRNCDTPKYYLSLNKGTIEVLSVYGKQSNEIYFSTTANAQKAIDILGEETIRTALSTDW